MTNNRVDFIRLFGRMELHAGLIILVPNVVPVLQRALFKAAILQLEGRELVNTVLEIAIKGKILPAKNMNCPVIGLNRITRFSNFPSAQS
ncbi:MAG: hypothetical protein JO033_06525 [Acidobacteriaceae bacterium]|nr:hypothetical protein [Acidobacteriaceae bacterium]